MDYINNLLSDYYKNIYIMRRYVYKIVQEVHNDGDSNYTVYLRRRFFFGLINVWEGLFNNAFIFKSDAFKAIDSHYENQISKIQTLIVVKP